MTLPAAPEGSDKPPEIRLNDDGSLDEVVAFGAYVHLEQMSATHWWMVVECGGKLVHINLWSKSKISARAEDAK